jgi:hypothetical protein
MSKKIDFEDILKDFFNHIIYTKIYIEIFYEIGNRITSLKHQALFVYLQQSSYDTATISVCKLFEESKRQKNCSVFLILEKLEANIKNQEPLEEYWNRIVKNSTNKTFTIKHFIEDTKRHFESLKNTDLKEIKKHRDKRVAHRQAGMPSQFVLKSPETFVGIANEAECFLKVVNQSCFPDKSPLLINYEEELKKPVEQLKCILEQNKKPLS